MADLDPNVNINKEEEGSAYTDLYVFFTENQEDAIHLACRLAACTSFLCSSVIVAIILRDASNKLQHVYQRLVLALSFTDMMSSLSLFTMGWMHHYQATCTIQGFMLQFGVSTALYNSCLCLHFLLIICYQWTPRRFSKSKIEIWMHCLALGYPLSIGLAGVIGRAYGEIEFFADLCHYTQYPEGRCQEWEVEDCPLQRWVFYLDLLGFAVPLLGSTLFISYCMVRIYCVVRNQERRQAAYEFSFKTNVTASATAPSNNMINRAQAQDPSRSESRRDEPADEEPTTPLRRLSSTLRRASFGPSSSQNKNKKRTLRRTKEAAKQAGLFIAAQLATNIPLTVSFVILQIDDPQKAEEVTYLFPCIMVFALTWPLQGLWNLIVYIRPRYQSLRTMNPKKTCCWVLRRAFFQSTKETRLKQDEYSRPRPASRQANARSRFGITMPQEQQQGGNPRNDDTQRDGTSVASVDRQGEEEKLSEEIETGEMHTSGDDNENAVVDYPDDDSDSDGDSIYDPFDENFEITPTVAAQEGQ